MITSSIASSAVQMVFKPQIIIPMIILILASSVVTELSGFVLDGPLNDLVLYGDNFLQDTNLLGFLLFNYPVEILELIVIGSLMIGISIIAIMSVSRMANGGGFVDSINDSVLEGAKTIGFVVLFWAIFVIVGGAFTLASLVGWFEPTLGLIIEVIFAIIIFIAFVKLIFAFPALIDKDLKKALHESWKFTNKRFWGALLLILIAGVIAFIIGLVLTQIGIYVGNVAEPILSAIGDAAGGTFFIAAVTNYFYAKQ